METEAADHTAMLGAEELHQLVVVRADALQQVDHGSAQLVDAENGVFPVRPQVLLAERGHAGEAGLGRFCLHARVTAHNGLLLDYLRRLHGWFHLTPAGPDAEGLRHGAEHRVLLQLRFGGEVGATLRTLVGLLVGVLPGGEQAVLAEVVSAGDRHRHVEGAQADAAGQLVLQTHEGKRSLVHLRHDVAAVTEAATEKRNLTSHENES